MCRWPGVHTTSIRIPGQRTKLRFPLVVGEDTNNGIPAGITLVIGEDTNDQRPRF
ncbi:MAG: hypothetical protein IPP25_22040 [Saprospiraceae bacterium]|nr:hypothetical protein [Candidatus Opimibacter skivensis]